MSKRAPELNKLSGYALILLSLTALLSVLSGYSGPPQPDEGTGAHIFQLSIVAIAPTILLFVATTDWRRPLRSLRPLAFSAAALVLAFGALYYLEHYRNPKYVGRRVHILSGVDLGSGRDSEVHTGKAQMPIRGPADRASAILHDSKSMGVRRS